ncbi:unnamed protein product [Tenebrio molitor]|nr:unnamed protein product [Tenebrio molitor]
MKNTSFRPCKCKGGPLLVNFKDITSPKTLFIRSKIMWIN